MAQGTSKGVPIDVDDTMSQNSDQLVPSQRAAKTYITNQISTVNTNLSGKVPTARTLTINGVTYDLSANRSWTIAGASLADGDYGDITVSGVGTVLTIDNLAVTDAKINDVAATKVTEDSTHRFVTDTDKSNWNAKLDPNTPIVGATKTKITYDADGLVTAGADATTADIADSLNKRYVTDAQLTVLGNTSGTNSGDETASSVGTLINGAAAATPNDTDLVATAEASVLKKITWTNVKAFLKTYFDTLYQAAGSYVTTSRTITINGDTKDLSADRSWTVTASAAWGSITGTLSSQTDLQSALDGKVDENVAIVGATKTKVTYDSKGLVTAGADATTADIADSLNKRYVTDAQLTVIGNTSGTNTGDQTSIVGISGTKAQFDTACSDGNFLYVGDQPSLSYASAFATGTTSVNTATYLDVTGCSVTLAAGTWIIFGHVVAAAANLIIQVFVAITDGSNNVIAESAISRPASGTASLNSPISTSWQCVVTPVGSTTYKLRAARGLTTHTSTYTIYDGTGYNTANHATNNSDKGTSIIAIRIA